MDYDYIIYGGFDAVVNTLKAIALIFSDNAYTTLFWAFAMLGLVYVFSSIYLGALLGGRPPGLIEWARSYWWAIFFYFLLIFPTGTLHVYDAHNNRYESVGKLPMGIVFVAGILNKVEHGLTEIVNTAMNPLISYRDAGGGKGFDMFMELYGFVQKNLKFPDEYDRMTLDTYTTECVLFSVLSGNISSNSAKTDNDFINNTFSQAANPAVYTTVYTENDRQGAAVTCQDAYNGYGSYPGIRGIFTSAYFETILKTDFCPRAGYSRDSPQELAACMDTLLKHLQALANFQGSNPSILIPQMYISQYINNMALSGNPALAAQFIGAREAGAGMTGVAIMANEFIPIFRSVMIAIAFAITPVLFLFLSTFALDAFAYYIGMLTWLVVWGVMDVVLHTFAMNYAYDIFTQIRDYQVSFSSIFLFDEYSAKALSVMGYMRVLGIMLSSSIVFGIMKFGGDALSRAGESIQGRIEGPAREAGRASLTAEGRSSYIDGLDRGTSGTVSQMARTPMDRWDSMVTDRINSVDRGRFLRTYAGGGSAIKAGEMTGTAAGVNDAVKSMATGDAVKAFDSAGEFVSQASEVEAMKKLTDVWSGMGQKEHFGNNDYREAAQKLAKAGIGRSVQEAEKTLRTIGKTADELGMPFSSAAALVGTTDAEKRAESILEYFNSEPVRGYMADKYGVSPSAMGTFEGFLKGNSSKEEFLASFKDNKDMAGLYNRFSIGEDGKTMSKEDMLKRLSDERISAGLELAGREGRLKSAGNIGETRAFVDDMEAFKKRYDETKKALGDIGGFRETAANMGWTTERFARAIAGKNYGSVATFMDRYAKEKGIGIDQAVGEISSALGGEEAGKIMQAYNKAEAWGLGRDAHGIASLTEFENKGLLTEKMAGTANKIYNTDFFGSGTQIREWGVGTDGKLVINRAMKTEGATADHMGRFLSWEHGRLTESGTMNKAQALNEARRREKVGDAVTAQGLKTMANGMKDGDSIEYSKAFGQDGKSIATAEYRRGSGTMLYDTAIRREGLDDRRFDRKEHYIGTDKEAGRINELLKASGYDTKVERGDMVTMLGKKGALGADANFLKNAKPGDLSFTAIQRGVERQDKDVMKGETGAEHIHKDVDKSVADHGIAIGSAMQMALAKDPAIAGFVSDHKLAKYKPEAFNARVSETAKDLGEDVGKWLERQGVSAGNIEGTISVGTPRIFGLGANGKLSRQSRESESVNLLTSEYDRLIRQSATEAGGKGLGREDTEKYVAEKIGEFTQRIYDQARKATSLDYGADAPIGMAKKILDDAKGR